MSLSLSGSFSFPHKYYRIIHSSSIQHALGQNWTAVCVCVCFIIKVDVSCYDSPHILMIPLQPICPQHRSDKQPSYTHTFSQMHMYTHTHTHTHTHALLSQHYQDRTQEQGSFHDRLSLSKTCTVFWVLDNLCFLHFCCSLEFCFRPKKETEMRNTVEFRSVE